MIIISLLLICVIWLGSALVRYRLNWKQTYSQRFANRENLSKQEFISKYYPASNLDREDIWRILTIVGKHYAVAPGMLRPTDSFKKEFVPPDSFFKGQTSQAMGLMGVMEKIVNEFDKELVNHPFDDEILTLGDLINSIANATKRHRER